MHRRTRYCTKGGAAIQGISTLGLQKSRACLESKSGEPGSPNRQDDDSDDLHGSMWAPGRPDQGKKAFGISPLKDEDSDD